MAALPANKEILNNVGSNNLNLPESATVPFYDLSELNL